MKEILKKLGAIQSALKAPKNQYSAFGGYNYRSCEDILESLKPLLRDQSCTLVLSDDVINVGDRYYIIATATIYDNESGDSFSNKAYAREANSKPKMDEAQVTGGASTYARKYALNGLFLIDDTKDVDTDEYKKQQGVQTAIKNPVPAPLQILCPKCGKEIKTIKKKNGELVDPVKILESCGGMCADCYKAESKK